MTQQPPAVVIVGRPNVGKSTLFNRITGQRRAIVGDEPGITRDRIHAFAEYGGRHFEVIDTGGIIPDEDELIPSEIFKQARVAIEQADHIIYVIDGRTEITGSDRELARLLHQTGKPVTLAVNKIDAPVRELLTHEFHELGLPHLFAVSAEHRLGIEELLDHVTEGFPAVEATEQDHPSIRVAIIGRPNVGKSTLFNALTAAGIASENYPFCTIEPNVGAVAIPDPRLATIRKYIESEKIIPAIFQLVDIAGLVRGLQRKGARNRGEVWRQLYAIGNKSLLFIIVTLGFIGMVMTYQACLQLGRVTGDFKMVDFLAFAKVDPAHRGQ